MTRATIATELGDIEIELYDQSAPKATQNFIDLAKKGFYDDVIFHRVIPGFVIQGGDGQYGKKSALERGRGRHRWAGLQVRGRAGQGRLPARLAGDGQRRTEHERQPVLHLHRRPDRASCRRTTRSSARSRKGLDVVDKIVSAPRDGTGPAARSGRDDDGDHPRGLTGAGDAPSASRAGEREG